MTNTKSGQIISLLKQAKRIARKYYELTGRPLGITGEVAEYEAARILGLNLAEVRQPGYDALEDTPNGVRKVQIKGRRLPVNPKAGQRIGSIRLDKEWDTVILVLMGLDYEVYEIWEADRPAVEKALKAPGSKARNERGALAVSKFKSIGNLRWKQ